MVSSSNQTDKQEFEGLQLRGTDSDFPPKQSGTASDGIQQLVIQNTFWTLIMLEGDGATRRSASSPPALHSNNGLLPASSPRKVFVHLPDGSLEQVAEVAGATIVHLQPQLCPLSRGF